MRIDLFRFVEDVTVYTLTTGDAVVTYAAEDYAPTAGMSRGQIQMRTELNKDNLDVTFPITNTTARHWMLDKVQALVTLTVFTQIDGETEVAWKGRMVSVKPDSANIVITFESVLTSLRRQGLGPRYQRRCRYSLYRRGCNLDAADFAEPATVVSVSGRVVTVSGIGAFADNFFTLGMLETADGELRFINSHTSGTLVLTRPVALAASDAVTLYPGCDRSRAVCDGKFNNLPNYGGFDWIPTRNPLNGSSII